MLNKKEIRKNVGCIFIAIIGLGVGLLLLGYLSSFVGWYGYKKWKYRVLSENIEESKKRGVFIKQLNYKVEGDCDSLYDFTPFIERGFRFGYHSATLGCYTFGVSVDGSVQLGVGIDGHEIHIGSQGIIGQSFGYSYTNGQNVVSGWDINFRAGGGTLLGAVLATSVGPAGILAIP